MKTIEASILVINYNNQRYIAQCIKSVLNQSINKNLEIIFHDDNSTDDSIKIAKKIKNIKIIKNKKKNKLRFIQPDGGYKKIFSLFKRGNCVLIRQ